MKTDALLLQRQVTNVNYIKKKKNYEGHYCVVHSKIHDEVPITAPVSKPEHEPEPDKPNSS
jgi:hypothetical protein